MARLIDLSHVIEHGPETYRGLPVPVISDFMTRASSGSHYAPGTEFYIGKIEMVANTGTYLDSPFHRHADGADLRSSRRQLADLEGVVVRAPVERGGRSTQARSGSSSCAVAPSWSTPASTATGGRSATSPGIRS
jgi:kynurenine formamidase